MRGIKEYLRLARIAKGLRTTFELWNYEEVLLPAIEEYSAELRKGTKLAYNNSFYLINPDATSKIISELKEDPEERLLRLYYIREVLDGDVKGRWEAGVELIGGKEIAMHVETILVAITALEHLGIEEFYVDLGSLRVWEEAIRGIELFREDVFRALLRRNFEIIEKLPISAGRKRILWELFNFRGKKSGIEKLDAIVEAINDERVFLDFGTVRPLPYYRDVIFEIYSPRLGRPIGGGGEYLVGGKKAIGFSLDLNSLLKLSEPKRRKREPIRESDVRKAYQKAREFVKLGIPVEVGM